MNTIWLKLAAVAVALVVVLIVGSKFMSNDSTPAPAKSEPEQPKTIYDMADRDKQMMEEPKPAEPEPQPEPAVEQAEQPTPSQPAPPAPAATQQPAPPASNVVLPSSITRATPMYFKPMSEMEDIEAQRLLPMATTGRSIGRLPVTHFKLMVDACRQILQKWPDSWYAFRAKQMLEDMPERFRPNYKVTEQELDISKFLKPRRGTEPRTVEPMR